MDKKLKEKLQDPGLAEKIAKETKKIAEELYLKDAKYVTNILGVQISEDLGIAVTKTEMVQFLALMYGALTCQERKIKAIKDRMLADIKKQNSKIAEDLINLKLPWEG
nr:MAG TPA: hypothetical protein [Caudoviricetes sp.]